MVWFNKGKWDLEQHPLLRNISKSWVTNFNADQRGGHSWTYYLTTSDNVSNGFATQFGAGCRTPFLTRILPGSGTGDSKKQGSFITGWPENVLLVSAKPAQDGRSCLLHLREINGEKAVLNLKNGLTGRELEVVEADVTGKPVPNPSTQIDPLESIFYRVYAPCSLPPAFQLATNLPCRSLSPLRRKT